MIEVNILKKLPYFDLNVEFNFSGGMLVLQGESGAGKTTILNCISGIKKPDKGNITLNKKNVYSSQKKINLSPQSRNIGYVFQNYALFPHMTVKENVLFGMESRKMKDVSYADYIMDAFRISHLSDRYPGQISGGEKQRTSLARALAVKPELILLDEPFAAIDSDTKQSVYEEFIDIKNKWKTDMILITHSEAEAQLLGDRIIKIRNGRIV